MKKRKKDKPKEKLFVVRKYVKATSVMEALKREKDQPVDDCWISDDWKEGKIKSFTDAIGFKTDDPEEEDEE